MPVFERMFTSQFSLLKGYVGKVFLFRIQTQTTSPQMALRQGTLMHQKMLQWDTLILNHNTIPPSETKNMKKKHQRGGCSEEQKTQTHIE